MSLSTGALSNLEVSCTALVNVTSGGPVYHAYSSDASLVTVETMNEGKAVSIKGVAKGKATVTVTNATGGSATVRVEVKDKS